MSHAHRKCLEHAEPRELGRYLEFLDQMDALRASEHARQGSRPEGLSFRARPRRTAARRRGSVLLIGLSIKLAVGEIAFATAMGWHERPTLTSGGVVRGYHLRIASSPDGCLLLREADADEDVFVLVDVQFPRRCTIVGWVRGRDGKRDQWRRDLGDGRGGIWFVPQASLHPLEALVPIPPRAG